MNRKDDRQLQRESAAAGSCLTEDTQRRVLAAIRDRSLSKACKIVQTCDPRHRKHAPPAVGIAEEIESKNEKAQRWDLPLRLEPE